MHKQFCAQVSRAHLHTTYTHKHSVSITHKKEFRGYMQIRFWVNLQHWNTRCAVTQCELYALLNHLMLKILTSKATILYCYYECLWLYSYANGSRYSTKMKEKRNEENKKESRKNGKC